VPRRRHFASLELDLLGRDARIEGQPVGLKPKEFDLLWRLADTPDQAVSRQALNQDVMGLSFEPTSNTIAVHVSRLRGKLGAAGLPDVVETESGGYRLRLAPVGLQAPWTAGLPASATADPRWS
jgi:two-component system, OmpR family, response regulator